MKSVKNFLIGFVVIYVVIGLGINMLYGPPGFSDEFLADHRDELDHYTEIVKSDEYKLWAENPSANPPDARLEQRIAFVEEFTANPAFQDEMDRRSLYNSITDWFNVIMLVVLVGVLARGPVATFVNGMVATERERIEAIERNRSSAARRKSEAERKLEQLEDERRKADKQAAARIAEEAAQAERTTEAALQQVRQEAEDRRRNEEALARQRLKAIVVEEAVRLLEQRYRREQSVERNEALVEQFLQELGERT